MKSEIVVHINDLRKRVQKGQEIGTRALQQAVQAKESVQVHEALIAHGAREVQIDRGSGEPEVVRIDFGLFEALGVPRQTLLRLSQTWEIARMIANGVQGVALTKATRAGEAVVSAAQLQKAAREYGRKRVAIDDAALRLSRQRMALERKEPLLLISPNEQALTKYLSNNQAFSKRAADLMAYRRRVEARDEAHYDHVEEEALRRGVPESLRLAASISGFRQAEVPDESLTIDPNELPPLIQAAIAMAENVRCE